MPFENLTYQGVCDGKGYDSCFIYSQIPGFLAGGKKKKSGEFPVIPRAVRNLDNHSAIGACLVCGGHCKFKYEVSWYEVCSQEIFGNRS